MDYIELSLVLNENTEENRDILAAELAELGFESFLESEPGLKAYARSEVYDPAQVVELLSGYPFVEGHESARVEDQNWNEEWEKHYFEPVLVGGRCWVRSSFHPRNPEAELEILVNPKMSFGTGHHATTLMMMEHLLAHPPRRSRVLDMGCGTGILSILAHLLEADFVKAIDIDEWAYRNSMENFRINGVDRAVVMQGDASKLRGDEFDLVLANIHLNVLLEDAERYKAVLQRGGQLVVSGFRPQDVERMDERMRALGFDKTQERESMGWAACAYALRRA